MISFALLHGLLQYFKKGSETKWATYILSFEFRRIFLSLVVSILYSFSMSALILSNIGAFGGLLASLMEISAMMFLKLATICERMQNTSTIKPSSSEY